MTIMNFKSVTATTNIDIYGDRFTEDELKNMLLVDGARLTAPSITDLSKLDTIGIAERIQYDESQKCLIVYGKITDSRYQEILKKNQELYSSLSTVLEMRTLEERRIVAGIHITAAPNDPTLMRYKIKFDDEIDKE